MAFVIARREYIYRLAYRQIELSLSKEAHLARTREMLVEAFDFPFYTFSKRGKSWIKTDNTQVLKNCFPVYEDRTVFLI